MDQPEIHFAVTSDGASIAYWAIGSGPPLIVTHFLTLSHAEMEWAVPSMAAFYRSLAKHHRLIRFDPRTAGMSSIDVDLDTTLTGMGWDISAVADACGVDEFALLVVATMGPVGIDYAATYPERVTHLILCETYATTRGTPHGSWNEAGAALARAHGASLATTLFHEIVLPGEVDAVVALANAGGRPDREEDNFNLAWNAADQLEHVEAPTLVLAARSSERISTLDQTRTMATLLPTAQLKSFEGTMLPYYADQDSILEAIGIFLGTDVDRTTETAGQGVTTVVFADVVGSTELITSLGDAEGRAALRAVEQTAADLAAKNGGEIIKYTGDGAMVAFASTNGALSFAVDIQQAMGDSPIELRIGMAAGEPIPQDGDLHGAVVHQASRIADQGDAGEIVVADSIRQLALGKGFDFEAAGEATLKGFDEPVRLWKVTGF